MLCDLGLELIYHISFPERLEHLPRGESSTLLHALPGYAAFDSSGDKASSTPGKEGDKVRAPLGAGARDT